MEALLKWLLTAQGISVTGVVLTFAALLLFGLHKRWWVPGWIYTEATTMRDEYKASLEERRDEDRARAEQLVEQSAAMKQQIEDLKIALVKRQERRSRQQP